ncbi:MAG: tetratricopeptide repeat protein, partial [Chloroflexi bacterium]|nr:tetratricopeptide repeat protein [Chloroflexota bacterium]
ALEWACERDLELARWLAGVLYWFWHYGDHLSEPRTWYARVLEAGERATVTRGLALALMGSGLVSTRLYYDGEAQSPLERSVSLWRQLGDKMRLAWSLWALARLLVYRGESARACALYAEHEPLFRASGKGLLLVGALSYWGRALTDVRRDDPAAKARLDEALSLGRIGQDPHGLYICSMNLGHWALAHGDYTTARRHYLESLVWRRQLGTRWLIALGLRDVAHVMCLQNDHQQAEPVYAEALALARALGDQRSEASIAQALGDVALHLGDIERAKALLTDSLTSFYRWSDALGIANGLRGFADLSQVQSQYGRAAQVLGFVEAWLQSNHMNFVLFERARYERSEADARSQLSASDFAVAWEAGRLMTVEEMIALMLGDAASRPIMDAG